MIDFLKTIDELHKCILLPDFWDQLSILLKKSFPCELASVFIQSPVTLQGKVIGTSGQEPQFLDQFKQHYCALNPWTQRMNPLQPGKLVLGEQFISDAELEKEEFYHDFMRYQNIFYWAGSVLSFEDGNATMLTIARPRSVKQFSAPDIDSLRRLLPHIQRAAKIVNHISGLRIRQQTMLESIETIPYAASILDEQGHAIVYNTAAKELFEESGGVGLDRHGQLTVDHPDIRSQLSDMVNKAIQSSLQKKSRASGSLSIPRNNGSFPILTIMTPLPLSMNSFGHRQIPRVIVIFKDLEKQNQPKIEILKNLWNFTEAESRVASHLLLGQDLRSIADSADVSMNTVKTHLKHILEKSGTHRQAAFVAAAHNTLSGIPSDWDYSKKPIVNIPIHDDSSEG